MPLSLRRSKNTTQTPNPKRTVSTPTLLSRFRSSAFSSSKTCLLATSPYESVKARTPPIPISRPVAATTRPPIKRPKPYGALHAGWRAASRRLKTPEQRDCLFGAECIEIRDPLLGRLDSPDVSVDLESDMSHLSISVIQEESIDIGMGGIEETRTPSPVIVRRPYHTLPHTPTPRPRIHNILRYSAPRKRVPISSSSKSVSVSHGLQLGPYHHMSSIRERGPDRTTELMAIDDQLENSSSFSSPIMVSANSPYTPRPRSPTQYRMSSRSVSPLTP